MSLKQALSRFPGVPEVRRRLDVRSLKPRSEDEDQSTRSKDRWRTSRPDADLTWGKAVTGHAFIRKAAGYGAFGPERGVLEIGPGYGRLVEAALEEGLPFSRWVGVDLSEETVDNFNARFSDRPVEAVLGDAETAHFGEEFDSMVSSLTLKHIFPTFERALANVSSQLRPGGLAIFDLIEGEREYFQPQDHVTFIREYTREEAADLVGRAGLELVALDSVDHDEDPQHRRLLVVGRKGG